MINHNSSSKSAFFKYLILLFNFIKFIKLSILISLLLQQVHLKFFYLKKKMYIYNINIIVIVAICKI